MRRIPLLLIAVLGAGLLAYFLVSRDGGPDSDGAGAGAGGDGASRRAPADGASVEDTVARDRVAAMVSKEAFGAARRVLAPLVERENANYDDLITAAVIELKASEIDAASTFVERARAVDPDGPAVSYLAGRIAGFSPDGLEEAIAQYRRAMELAPDDLPSKYSLARSLTSLDTPEANAEAATLFREIEAIGIEHGGPWYASAVYQLFQLLAWIGDDQEEADKYEKLWDALDKRGLKSVKETDLHEGELARVRPPSAIGNWPTTTVSPPTYEREGVILPELGGGSELTAQDLNGDRMVDLVSAGEGGIVIALRQDDGGWRVERLTAAPAHLVRAIDLFKDDSLDLVFLSGSALALLECEGEFGDERWVPTPIPLPALPSAPSDMELVDFDHDGDLDLFLVGDFGGRLLRNDGVGHKNEPGETEGPGQPAERTGSFTDASADANLPTDAGWRWCAIEDLDTDQDVDLLMGGPGKVFIGSSLRSGRFEDVAAFALNGAALDSEPLVCDFDGDARPDLFGAGDPATLFLQGRDGRFTPTPTEYTVPQTGKLIEVDIDLDGTVDALWPANVTAAGTLALSHESQTTASFGAAIPTADAPLVVTDLEWGYGGTLAWELLRLGQDGVHVYRTKGPVGNATRLKFTGQKDNRQAIGAVVELRAAELYRRHFWRGTTTLYGLGTKTLFDVVRVTWPNGVIGSELDVEQGHQILDSGGGIGVQPEGLVGSCPFLYTWNGETYEFISDVLGITPLGLPMAPGMLVPPDHDEYVLVRGDQLVPKDGKLVLQFTEELREVTYLDRVRLDVVDHPIGYEVQPNERFSFPPFPEPHTHVMAEPLAPRRATGSDGADWTEALRAVDSEHAIPFEPLADGQFLGLAQPHWLELEFDADELAERSGPLRLLCTGWFYWTDASVNVAAARTPGVDFVPPQLWVPEGDGWAPTGPPVGFPAGKTKTMVLDVTDLVRRDDPRLRISSTLRLYWDSIRLAVGDDGEARTTSLEPESARLWARGFSRPIESERKDLPERFVWDELADEPRWNQHPGSYTRFGETLPLVTAIDDQFVIMGSGDALTIEFDASDLPPLPAGYERDYLVFLDGWAKDRDPNTVQALEVEPLPFHGMSGYPYREDEHFPDGDEHRRWREEWNTRASIEHIIPLSPRRERRWIAGQ